MRLGIVKEEQQVLDVVVGAISLELLELCATVSHLLSRQSAFAADPGARTRERMIKTRYAALPLADVKIEIVLPVSR